MVPYKSLCSPVYSNNHHITFVVEINIQHGAFFQKSVRVHDIGIISSNILAPTSASMTIWGQADNKSHLHSQSRVNVWPHNIFNPSGSVMEKRKRIWFWLLALPKMATAVETVNMMADGLACVSYCTSYHLAVSLCLAS
jgi:hypothetical protein